MIGKALDRVRAARPLVHCITNYVTANDCANLLLASGASPVMADDPQESAEVTAACGALVVNMGTLNPRRLEAMLHSGRTANALHLPVVLDPVGAGASSMRRDAAAQLLREVRFGAIRGNASEIRTLAEGTYASRGVDADDGGMGDAAAWARRLARETGAVVTVTGESDIVTDGEALYRVRSGHEMMRLVTGAGCQLSALLGAFLAANREEPLLSALAAACAMGLCGERAHSRLTSEDGNAALRGYIIDAMYRLTGRTLEEGARYEAE